jgi:hypothetical protein
VGSSYIGVIDLCKGKDLARQVEAVRSQTRGASSYVSEAQSTHMHQSPFE